MFAAAPKPRNWTRRSDLVQTGAGANLVVVVAGAGVDVQAMGRLERAGADELVQEASVSVTTTAAIAPSLRTVPIIMLARLRMPTNGPRRSCARHDR